MRGPQGQIRIKDPRKTKIRLEHVIRTSPMALPLMVMAVLPESQHLWHQRIRPRPTNEIEVDRAVETSTSRDRIVIPVNEVDREAMEGVVESCHAASRISRLKDHNPVEIKQDSALEPARKRRPKERNKHALTPQGRTQACRYVIAAGLS